MKKVFFLFFAAILSGFAQNTSNTVSLNIKIANRFSDTIIISQGRTFKQKVGINKNGVFQTSFETSKDGGLYRLNDGNEGTTMFLKNGYDLTLTLDTKDLFPNKGVDMKKLSEQEHATSKNQDKGKGR